MPSGLSDRWWSTNSNGFPIAPLLLTLQGRVDTHNAIDVAYDYQPVSSVPIGQWAYLPIILKAFGGQSSTFTLMNPDSSAQNYAITYWDHSGNFVTSASLSLIPNDAWYASQSVDSSLPDGFDGSVQITNLTGGSPPVAVAILSAGPSRRRRPALASATPLPTATPTPPLRRRLPQHQPQRVSPHRLRPR